MNWKVVFLAILILSAVAVTICVTQLNVEIPNTIRENLPKVYLDEPVPLQPIPDDSGGG